MCSIMGTYAIISVKAKEAFMWPYPRSRVPYINSQLWFYLKPVEKRTLDDLTNLISPENN